MKTLIPFLLLLLFSCADEPAEQQPLPVAVNAQSDIPARVSPTKPVADRPEIAVPESTAPEASAAPTEKKTSPKKMAKKQEATEKKPVRKVTRPERTTTRSAKPVDVPAKPSKPVSTTTPKTLPPAELSAPVERPRAAASVRPAGSPVISFESTVWNFGELEEGETVDHKFKFRNTGDAPLEITNTTATCGCTKPLYPFMPIMPGEEGHISVRYNSKGKFGTQRPVVTVSANTKEGTHKLYLEGSVRTEVVGN